MRPAVNRPPQRPPWSSPGSGLPAAAVVVGDGRRGSGELRAPDGELLQSLECDVVLMDLSMPVMDGIEPTPRIVEATPASRAL
jgi:CheY-like chemotaxis protein